MKKDGLLKVFVCLIGVISLIVTLGGFGSPAFLRQSESVNTDQWLREQQKVRRLTIDAEMQTIAKEVLNEGIASTSAKQGTVLVIESDTGAIKTMVNIPESNLAMTPWEPGSVLKPLMLASALNEGSVTPETTYSNFGAVWVGDRIIQNVTIEQSTTASMPDILSKSLNTGAVFLLTSLGGGVLNHKARTTWHHYLTEQYRFSTKTGVDIPNEKTGFIRSPEGGRYLDFRYAGMSFGVGLTVTPLQLASAYASLVNGGIYYVPHISEVPSKVVSSNVVSPEVSNHIKTMLQAALLENNAGALQDGLIMGGKTGTAPLPGQDGAYKRDIDSGTYIGFVGTDKPKYIILVRIDEPKTENIASSHASVMWADFVRRLHEINKFTP